VLPKRADRSLAIRSARAETPTMPPQRSRRMRKYAASYVECQWLTSIAATRFGALSTSSLSRPPPRPEDASRSRRSRRRMPRSSRLFPASSRDSSPVSSRLDAVSSPSLIARLPTPASVSLTFYRPAVDSDLPKAIPTPSTSRDRKKSQLTSEAERELLQLLTRLASPEGMASPPINGHRARILTVLVGGVILNPRASVRSPNSSSGITKRGIIL
jgi:hypothetical protein